MSGLTKLLGVEAGMILASSLALVLPVPLAPEVPQLASSGAAATAPAAAAATPRKDLRLRGIPALSALISGSTFRPAFFDGRSAGRQAGLMWLLSGCADRHVGWVCRCRVSKRFEFAPRLRQVGRTGKR